MMLKTLAAAAAVGMASGTTYFSETFGSGWEGRWTTSKWKESEGTSGKFELHSGKWHIDEEENAGLYTAEDSKFFGISAGFPSFSNKDKELIIQYQAKYEKDIECGGGYIKVGPKQDDLSTFGDPTPYNVMFGPDKCGYNKRTHLIFNYKGKNVLKEKDLPYKQDDDGTSHVYRLVIRKDNTARVEIDGKEVYDGSIVDDWTVLEPKEIDDPDDKKPSDWEDEANIKDPEASKPADWVEESEKRIVDPEASKPDDWDDEEDGEWEAPMKDNPDYKGEWVHPKIANPKYIGVWAPKKIDNPAYQPDDQVYAFDNFGFIGFDLWQVKGNTIFDNIIITDEVAEADAFVAKWEKLSTFEKEKLEEEKAAEKPAEEVKEDDDDDKEDDDDDEEDDDDDEEGGKGDDDEEM